MKRILLVILVAFLVSCQPNDKANQPAENVETVKAMFDAFNRHDWEGMAAYYADSAQFLDPSFGKEYVKKGRAETATKYREMEAIFPDIHDEVIGLYPSGDKVIVEFISTGTDPSGGKFSLPISCILTLESGKIVKDATYYDNSQP